MLVSKMVANGRTQSLTDFGQNPSLTIDRLKATGEVETLVENGEPQAVLMSPEAYDRIQEHLLFAEDIAAISRSMLDIQAGRVKSVDEAFDEIHAHLLSLKAEKEAGGK
jgi:prevent-host-death family protein